MTKDIYQVTKERRSYYNIDDQIEEPDEKEFEPLKERIEVYK